MKISNTSASSDQLALDEQYFSLQDKGMIFEILRSKMYSNPILAICREISCNARDAHREAGKSDTPIEIHLPNHLDPFLKIKDFGPGISPERISNIFIKYTASTKTNDNTQTGGFGLGAKTPFSYSDSFNIKTNYNGTQYNYACFIDETKVGKISLLDDHPTSDPNGTEIIVPVKSHDFVYFSDNVELSTRWWDVKPTIKGNGNFFYKNQEILLNSLNWMIVHGNKWDKSIKVIIDGIEYPLNISSLRLFANSEIDVVECCKGEIFLKFSIGELSLSANREQIYLDDETKKKIKTALLNIKSDIMNDLQKSIESADNLWDANIIANNKYTHLFERMPISTNHINWQGISVSFNNLNIKCPVTMFSRGGYSKYSREIDNKKVSKRENGSSLLFLKKSILTIDDLPKDRELTCKDFKNYLQNNPDINHIQVVTPSINPESDVSLSKLNEVYHFNKLYPKKLSEIIVLAKKRAPYKSRFTVYKYDVNESALKQVAYSAYELDTYNKIYCKYRKNSHGEKFIIINNEKYVDFRLIKKLLSNFHEYSLYAIDDSLSNDKIEDHFEDAISLQEFLEEKILNSGDDYNQIAYFSTLTNKLDNFLIKMSSNYIDDYDSIFLQKYRLESKIKHINFNCDYKLDLYKLLCNDNINIEKYIQEHPEDNFEILNQKFSDKYPLLRIIDSYYYSTNLKAIADYINLVDQKQV